mgnify:CR=1 FL=1
MKLKLILFLLLAIPFVSFAQNDYATIYIYRPSNFVGSMVTDHIYFNNKKICEIKNGGYLEYKVFTDNTIVFSVFGTALGTESDKLTQINLNVIKGQTYYFKIFPQLGKIGIEQLSEPIKKSNLNQKKFISLSDIGTIYENANPDTDWTYSKLIEHWTKSGISDIEGIYERVSAQIEYRLAVLKENNEYKIIYLSGAKGTGWREGDIKATLRKTAQFGLFKSNWKMINKSNNKDVNIVFESATMKTLSEAGDNSQDLYLKMYPTYDEEANSKIVAQSSGDWKPSGTGFFIDKNGFIATNYHVIEDAKEIQVNINNKSYLAKLVISDIQNDLAILKIVDNNFIPLTNLNYNFKSETSDVGTSVFALGFPLTSLLGEEIKYTTGAISSKSGMKGDITTYQISVPIQPGNSGGPLFDNDGNLIGITSSGINRKLDLTENVNYAIKTIYLKLLIDEMNEKIEVPTSIFPKNKLLTEKIKTLEKNVVFIKVK